MEKLRGGAKNLENKHVASGRKHVVRVCTRCSASRCTFGVIAEKWLHRIFLKFCHGRADDVCGRLQNYRKIYGADFSQSAITCFEIGRGGEEGGPARGGSGGRLPPGRALVSMTGTRGVRGEASPRPGEAWLGLRVYDGHEGGPRGGFPPAGRSPVGQDTEGFLFVWKAFGIGCHVMEGPFFSTGSLFF